MYSYRNRQLSDVPNTLIIVCNVFRVKPIYLFTIFNGNDRLRIPRYNEITDL